MEPRATPPRQATPLRRALVLVTVGAIAVASAVLGAVYVTSTRAILIDHIDERLDDAVNRLSKPKPGPAQAGEEQPADSRSEVERLLMKPGRGNPDFAIVIDPGGGYSAGTVRDGEVVAVSGERIDALAESPPLHRIETAELADELGRYRVGAGVDDGGRTVVLGVSLGETDAVLTQSVVVAVWTSLAVATAAGIVVLLWGRRALRPLEKVVQTASRISRSDLQADPEALRERVAPADSDERSEAGRVGAALNRLLDHIGRSFEQREAVERRLRVFVADASHELRTPLASIRGYAELTRLSGEQLPPDSAHALRRIEEESARMGAIVDDLLLLARLDQELPMRLEPFDLAAILADLVEDARVAAPGHVVELRLPGEALRGSGDEDRIRQAIGNVITNAWRHTPEGTRVLVEARRHGSLVEIDVSDTGPGLPEGALDTVFERFVRVDGARSREQGGTGLGLAIARSVIEAHGGTIALESAPGRTVFSIALPSALAET